MKHLKVKFLLIPVVLCAFAMSNGQAASLSLNGNEDVVASSAANAAMAEAKYDRLMRIFINRIKLAFTEADDAKTLEILNQFSQQFSQQTDGIKNELAGSVKYLSKEDAEALFNRLVQKSRNEELIALIFDERVSIRVEKNPEIKVLMEALQAKSLEIQKRDFFAAMAAR
jgi:hypothetical protein